MMRNWPLQKRQDSAAINSNDEDAAMKIFEITGGGAKSVIDFVGAAPAFEFAYGLFGLVRGGTYVLVGLLVVRLRFNCRW